MKEPTEGYGSRGDGAGHPAGDASHRHPEAISHPAVRPEGKACRPRQALRHTACQPHAHKARPLIKPVRSYNVTTNSHHRFRKHKNLVENMEATRPEEIWVSDITYIGNRSRHMYLSLVTDAYSKKIMGYCLSGSLDTQGPLDALKMANRNRLYKGEPLIHHSDRGIQYCSDAYQKMLTRYCITPSMTESYDPYSNAVAERVNGILKQEFLLEELDLPLRDMRRIIKDAVYKYNNLRPHYSCGYKTPEYMHHQNQIKIRNYRNKQSSKALAGL